MTNAFSGLNLRRSLRALLSGFVTVGGISSNIFTSAICSTRPVSNVNPGMSLLSDTDDWRSYPNNPEK